MVTFKIMRKLPLMNLLALVTASSAYLSTGISSLEAASEDPSRPNVVLIVCDDLNDYVEGFGGHPQTKTPNMAKLAKNWFIPGNIQSSRKFLEVSRNDEIFKFCVEKQVS